MSIVLQSCLCLVDASDDVDKILGIDLSDSETMPLELPVTKKRATAKSESKWKCHACGWAMDPSKNDCIMCATRKGAT